jgi:hypothetical protein
MYGDVKAAIWLAERLNPEEYAKQERVTITQEPPPRLARRSWNEIPTLDAVEAEFRPVDDADDVEEEPDDTSRADEPEEAPGDERPQTTALALRFVDR